MIKTRAMSLSDDAVQLTTAGLLEHSAISAQILFAMRGEVVPMFVAVAGRMLYAILTPWRDDDEKRRTLETLRTSFEGLGVTHYAVMSEAWMAKVDPRTEPRWAELSPAKRNDRSEIVTVLVADRNGVAGSLEFYIERPFDGSPPSLRPFENQTWDCEGGPFGSLLMTDRL